MRFLPTLMGVLVFVLPATGEEPLNILATMDGKPQIGHILALRLEITNRLNVPVVLLEVKPQQPCEQPVSLLRSLYGDIRYDEESDSYIHDSLTQKAGMIPVLDGYLSPGKTLFLNLAYRPFSEREVLQVAYVVPEDRNIYGRKGTDGSVTRYAKDGKDFREVIIPQMSELERKTMDTEVFFSGITGTPGPYCYCEVLREHTDWLPASLCKDWDTGKTVLFRIGDQQQGMGPDPLSAEWKFLDEFPVEYGDGMYTHGEFVRVSPDEASRFARRIRGKFMIRRVSYFFDRYYYDMEMVP